MNKDTRSQQQKPQQGTRIEDKKWVVKAYNEENQSLPKQKQLNNNIDFSTKPISEFIQPSPESARRHPEFNGFDPNQQTHDIENTLSVFNKEKQQQEEEVRECEQSGGEAGDEEEVLECEKSEDEAGVRSSRLEEIRLAAQEPKLSEEQLRVNDRLQEEEIIAMEAIYGENVVVLEREDGLRSFQINIHIEVPDNFLMYTEIGSFDGEVEFCGIDVEQMATSDNPDRLVYSFKVQYLPPIVLTCLLPKAYPSHCAPFFTISVQWLDVIKISSLCQMLDMIWTGQSRQEIVYPWVDWLQNSTLSYFEFDKRIPVASLEKADNAEDRRAISESVSPDVDIPSILHYNDNKGNESFCQDLHQCCICLSEYAGTRFIRLPCKHFFCRNCMETYSTMQAKEGATIQCPQIKCREIVPPGLVKSLLGNENFEQWESLLFNKTLDSMSDLVYCPRCETACLEDKDHLAQCPMCFFAFCGLCRERLHVGVQCITPEEKYKLLQEKLIKFLQQNRQPVKITQPTQNSQPKMTKEQRKEQRKALRELNKINKLLNEEEIMRTAKHCPKCSVPIYRSYGCNEMRCTNCGQYFCYKCLKKYTSYKRPCTCTLDLNIMGQQREEREAEEKLRREKQEPQQFRHHTYEVILSHEDRRKLINRELKIQQTMPTHVQFATK